MTYMRPHFFTVMSVIICTEQKVEKKRCFPWFLLLGVPPIKDAITVASEQFPK